MLRVGLGDVETLDRRRVAADPVAEQLGVVVEIAVVEGQAHLPVEFFERGASPLEDRDGPNGLGGEAVFKSLQGLRVGLFGHSVVDQGEEEFPAFGVEGFVGFQLEPPGPLDADDGVETAGAADRHGVGRPGGREAHPGADLEDRTAERIEEGTLGEPVGFEGFREEPPEDRLFSGIEGTARLYVETVLRSDLADRRGDAVADGEDQSPPPPLGRAGGAKKMPDRHAGVVPPRSIFRHKNLGRAGGATIGGCGKRRGGRVDGERDGV